MIKKEVYNRKHITHDISVYITNIFNITKEELLLKSKYYIKEMLYEVRKNNNTVKLLRKRRKEKQEDLDLLEKSYVRTNAIDTTGTVSFTDGQRPNNELTRHYQIMQLQEELQDLVVESLLIEKTLEQNNKLVRSFIELLPQRQWHTVMEYAFFEAMHHNEIAIELNYSRDYIKQIVNRSITELAKIFKSDNPK